MSGPGSLCSRIGQASLCLLALAAASGGLLAYQHHRAERAAVESCESFLERKGIAPGQVKHQQKLLVCPPPPPPATVRREPSPPSREGRQNAAEGLASWYGGADGLKGARTASGELFDPSSLTAAHPTLPFGTRVRVTLLKTGRSTIVRINDRGPSAGGRMIDISRAAAAEIGLLGCGVGRVTMEVLP